jgi:hypothetical protein
MRQARGEMAYMLFACSGFLGLFKGLGLEVPALQTVLWLGVGLSAILLLLSRLTQPGRLLITLILIPLLIAAGYGLLYGIAWYFFTYLPSKGPLFKLGP